MVARVTADEPVIAAITPQPRMLACNRPSGIRPTHGDRPRNMSDDRFERNRISPIQINNGKEVSAQPQLLSHIVDAINDPMGVLDAQPFLHQMLALAVNALGVLLLGRRHTHHAANLPVAQKVCRQYAQHAFRVAPIGFRPTGAPIDENAGRLEHMVGDAVRGQEPMEPEAVTPGLEAAMKRRRRICPGLNRGTILQR